VKKSIHLFDLIKQEKLDDILKVFTEVTGVASIIADVNGQPITKPHNFSVLCRNYCRSSKLGKQKCHESDSYGGKQSAKLKKRFIYKCLNAGLLDSASPIIVKNYHLATVLCGQVLDEPIPTSIVTERARSIGVRNIEGYLSEFEKIPLMSPERFESIVSLMEVVTLTISELALKKYLSFEYSQHYLDKLINSVSDSIISTNPDTTISMVNDACANMFGHEKEKLIGQSIFSLFSDSASIRAYQKQMELSLKGNGRSELTAVDADSQYFPVQMSLSSFKTDNNKKPGYVAVLRDISEEKKTERMKNDLVGMLTHDMGNPILSIQKAIELMVNGTLGQLKPNQMEIMDLALTTSNQLLGMVTDFLDIYQNENGQFLLRKLPIDMNQMLQGSINQLKILALEKQILVHYDPISTPLMLNGDQTRLMRTIINILDNAIKFSPESGRINVSSILVKENDDKKAGAMINPAIFRQLEGNQQYVLITITDHGPGIPKYYQKNIFEKFFTNNPIPNKGKRGLGLGLAFCKLVVEAHEGLIWTKSPLYDDDGEKNKGCCFNFILPTNFDQ
ncbi:MAG: PocR ligand-binding domain-containing protein, partial [Deltaproteobacteria bacterium]|nr:PocR ligand-binding domain-containing protein [Deltaproteobacteria bacterium]